MVPTEILDKRGILSRDECSVMKSHSFFTFHLLDEIKGFEDITRWASSHHERPDGKGYPFHLKGAVLSCGERIMAVADIFNALTEDRPCRAGLSLPDTLRVIEDLAVEHAMDGDVVGIARRHPEELDSLRLQAEREMAREYGEFIRGI